MNIMRAAALVLCACLPPVVSYAETTDDTFSALDAVCSCDNGPETERDREITADQDTDSSLDEPARERKERLILGWAEPIRLEPWGITVEARLDTGAKTSSLHATNIERIRYGDEKWVRFQFDPNDEEPTTIEAPLVRNVIILRHDGDHQRRPVVKLGFCLNGEQFEGQFSLIDRNELTYPALLGRRFLRNVALVDSSHRFLTKPTCGDEATK